MKPHPFLLCNKMSTVYPIMKHNSTMIYVYKFSLIISESTIEEFSAQINACHDDVKDLPAPQILLIVSNVGNKVIISSEF